MTADTIVRVRTFAKVNLFLHVIGLRGDGFHEVETVLHGVGLYDEIEIEPSERGVEVSMELMGAIEAKVPSSDDNLISRAARLLLDGGEGERGVTVRVKKGVPIAAGLGGGSGNAAGALVTLAEMWGLDLDRDRLRALATELGSDVPYCLDGGTALATSRGEQLTPLLNIQPMWFVLGGTNQPLYTREIYELWDSSGTSDGVSASPLILALGAGDATEVATLLHNDLERPAFTLRPELAGKKEALVRAGALGAAMSGSGPTMFAIAADEEAAKTIASKVEETFDWVRVVKSQGPCIERLD